MEDVKRDLIADELQRKRLLTMVEKLNCWQEC